MNEYSRVPAVIAYIPVLGWLYVLLLQRQNPLALFHVRQAIGLVLFLLGVAASWVVIGWVVAWIPFGILLSTALFAVVIAAAVFSIIALISGVIHAGQGRAIALPLFGDTASRMRI